MKVDLFQIENWIEHPLRYRFAHRTLENGWLLNSFTPTHTHIQCTKINLGNIVFFFINHCWICVYERTFFEWMWNVARKKIGRAILEFEFIVLILYDSKYHQYLFRNTLFAHNHTHVLKLLFFVLPLPKTNSNSQPALMKNNLGGLINAKLEVEWNFQLFWRE